MRKVKDIDFSKVSVKIIEKGCGGCPRFDHPKTCTIMDCNFLPERDLHDKRITEKEYKEHRKKYGFEDIVV